MEATLAQDEEYQFKVEQANFRKDQYLVEEVERSTKRRRETGEGSEGHVAVQVIRNFLRAQLKVIKNW